MAKNLSGLVGVFYSLRFICTLGVSCNCNCQSWSRGHKARGQGQGHKKNPRPRTAFPRTDTLEAKDRNARGQGQGPRTQAPRTQAPVGLHKNFSGDLHKKSFPKNFSSAPRNFNNSKGRPRGLHLW